MSVCHSVRRQRWREIASRMKRTVDGERCDADADLDSHWGGKHGYGSQPNSESGWVTAIALVPPVLATLAGVFQSTNRVLAILAFLTYEIVILVLGVGLATIKKVRERWVERLADKLDMALQRLISGYGRAYLKHVKAAHRYVDWKGLSTRGEYTLSLDEIFIQLSVAPQAIHDLSSHPLDVPHRPGPHYTIWHWIQQVRTDGSILAIIGPPGCGKTTLLKHVAYIMASGGKPARKRTAPNKLPVLIALRDFRKHFAVAGEAPTLVNLIRAAMNDVAKDRATSMDGNTASKGNFSLCSTASTSWLIQQLARQCAYGWIGSVKLTLNQPSL